MKSALCFCLAMIVAVLCLFALPACADTSDTAVLNAAPLPSVLPQGVVAITRESVVKSVSVAHVGCQCGCGKEVCDCAECQTRTSTTAVVRPKRERITVYYTPGPGNRKVAKGTAIQLKHGSN